MVRRFLFLGVLFLAVYACRQEKDQTAKQQIEVPTFNADSTYHHIVRQLDFGSRVPNTPAHDSCAKWLIKKLEFYGLKVTVQKGEVKAYDNTILKIQNIIAAYRPERKNRLLLFSHWDTRPYADQDDKNMRQPIPGANDGASGVAVLLEIARLLSTSGPDKGIDIILFDAEDYGPPSWKYSDMEDPYCLGTQYWIKHPHANGYSADFGILLDMVGAHDAKFYQEGTSLKYAPDLVRKVWNTAAALGYSDYFHFEKTAPITDDHLYLNKDAGIPSIDIIHYDPATEHHFGKYWHTHKDNIEAIDKKTLKAVGQTLTAFVWTTGL